MSPASRAARNSPTTARVASATVCSGADDIASVALLCTDMTLSSLLRADPGLP
ncbi:hypothetical protein SGLAM104S_08070 [Streptomyces glaucescens]